MRVKRAKGGCRRASERRRAKAVEIDWRRRRRRRNKRWSFLSLYFVGEGVCACVRSFSVLGCGESLAESVVSR